MAQTPADERERRDLGSGHVRLAGQIAVLVAVTAVATLLAIASDAPNLGTALTFGQIAFAVALVVVLVRT